MSSTTPNLGLFKYDPTTDANVAFSITNALNNNWDKIDDIPNQLNNKVDLDAQNLSIAGKSLISGLGMPSSKYIDLTLGASGSTYTAPANGYFHFYSSSVSNSILVNRTKGYGSTVIGTNGYANHNLLFVNKNDVVNLSYSTSLNSSISFFYANGSESEA